MGFWPAQNFWGRKGLQHVSFGEFAVHKNKGSVRNYDLQGDPVI